MRSDAEKATGEARILIVDDDAAVLRSLGRALRGESLGEPLLCDDPRRVEALLTDHRVGVVLLDLMMPHIPGEELLASILSRHPDLSVIVCSAVDDVETAVRCVQAGAVDYVTKPVDFSRLVATVARSRRQWELRDENRRLRELVREPDLKSPGCFERIVTRSMAMRAMFRYVEGIAPSSEPVLIVGETGVGKELVAQALHCASGRESPMVSVNVAGIDDTAFADTLFGHVKGAFTGADTERDGMIQRAAAGTLVLDEIGDLGTEMQTKLLRVLQEQEYFPLGSDTARRSRCRIVAATNRDLRKAMREDRFRADLYYRLHSHLVRVPPLRERTGDIPLLLDAFLNEAAEMLDKTAPTVPKELSVHLSTYAFPGNVRELRAMVMDAMASHERGVLSMETFLNHIDTAGESQHPAARKVHAPEGGVAFGRDLPTVDQLTRMLVSEALKRAEGNQGAAARMIGVSRRTVNRYASDVRTGSRNP